MNVDLIGYTKDQRPRLLRVGQRQQNEKLEFAADLKVELGTPQFVVYASTAQIDGNLFHPFCLEGMFVMSPIKTARAFLFSFLCLLSIPAADLKTFGDVYQKETQEILQSFQPKFDGLQQQYQKSLETLKTCAQNKGDFKTTKAAVDELERFQKARTLPASPNDAEITQGNGAWTGWEVTKVQRLTRRVRRRTIAAYAAAAL